MIMSILYGGILKENLKKKNFKLVKLIIIIGL